MKKLMLFSILVAGCTLPRYKPQADANFKPDTSPIKARLSCNTRAGSAGTSSVQSVVLVETTDQTGMDLVLENFLLKDTNQKVYPAKAWQFSTMDDLDLNLGAFSLNPRPPGGDQVKAHVDAHHAVLLSLEFSHPVTNDYYFQIVGNDKTVMFSALCHIAESELEKSLRAAPNK